MGGWSGHSLNKVVEQLHDRGVQLKLRITGPLPGLPLDLKTDADGVALPLFSALRERSGLHQGEIATRTDWSVGNVGQVERATELRPGRIQVGVLARYLSALGCALEGEYRFARTPDRNETFRWKAHLGAHKAFWGNLVGNPDRPLPQAEEPRQPVYLAQLRSLLNRRSSQLRLGQATPERSLEQVKRLEAQLFSPSARVLQDYLKALSPDAQLELHVLLPGGQRVALAFEGTGAEKPVSFRALREHFNLGDVLFENRMARVCDVRQLDQAIQSGEFNDRMMREALSALGARPEWVAGIKGQRVALNVSQRGAGSQ